MKSKIISAVSIILIFCIGAAIRSIPRDKNITQDPIMVIEDVTTEESPRDDDEDIQIESTSEISKEDLVIMAAKDLVQKSLKSPLSAKWNKVEILDNDSYGRYLLYVEVDSSNSYNVMIRTKLYVVILNVNENGEYQYDKAFSIMKANSDSLDSGNIIEIIKSVNHWDIDESEVA